MQLAHRRWPSALGWQPSSIQSHVASAVSHTSKRPGSAGDPVIAALTAPTAAAVPVAERPYVAADRLPW